MFEQLQKSIQSFEALAITEEARSKLYRYNDALMQSLHSIIDDKDCDSDRKMQYLSETLAQYSEAMKELIPKIVGCDTPKTDDTASSPTLYPVISKSDPDRFIEIEEIQKFNPYHDRLGRFATANGATSFTYAPGKSKAHDNAIEREKERHVAGGGKLKNDNPLNDPDTIAGVKRGEPMTREQADEGKANPNFSKGGGYYINCQSCVVTYEARRRGYDVITKPNTRGSKLEQLSRASHEAWIDPATGKTPERPKPNEFVTTPTKCRNMLENTIQQGERYTFGHSWKGRSRSGHIICADRDDSGNLRLFDPQNGKTMTGSDIDGYLSRIKYTTSVYGMKINCSPRLLRVDNLSLNPEYVNDIMEANK